MLFESISNSIPKDGAMIVVATEQREAENYGTKSFNSDNLYA